MKKELKSGTQKKRVRIVHCIRSLLRGRVSSYGAIARAAGWPGAARQVSDLFWLRDSAAGWGILFLLAAGPTVAGFGLYNVSLSYLPSSVANLIVTLEPAFTAVTAYILLGERLSAIQLGGSLMIMAGVILLRVYDGWAAARLSPVVLKSDL